MGLFSKIVSLVLLFATVKSFANSNSFSCEANYPINNYISGYSLESFSLAKTDLMKNCIEMLGEVVCNAEPLGSRCINTRCEADRCIVVSEAEAAKWVCEGSYFKIGFSRGKGETRNLAFNDMIRNCRSQASKQGLTPDVFCDNQPENLVCEEIEP